MYAVFQTGGKQFRAEPGYRVRVPTLAAEPGETVTFDRVLLASDGSEISVEQLRDGLEPMIGQLPYIVGVDPFFVFPSAVVMMTFLSFFIGVFLQLLWEELPITEPL